MSKPSLALLNHCDVRNGKYMFNLIALQSGFPLMLKFKSCEKEQVKRNVLSNK